MCAVTAVLAVCQDCLAGSAVHRMQELSNLNFKVCHTSCGKKWRMWLFAKDVGLRAVVLVHGMHAFDRKVNKRCQCMHASAFALNANVSILAGLEECHPA